MCRENLKLLALGIYTISGGSLVIACLTGTSGLLGVSLGFSLTGMVVCAVINFKQ
jgi:hypothetical protein